MNKEYFRVTYENKGIYNELKNKVDRNTWESILSKKEINWLPKPPSYAENNKSYFTKKGYDKFNQDVLPIIEKYIDKDKIDVKIYSKIHNIIYEDEFQVVVSK